jgi:hypothetical protein
MEAMSRQIAAHWLAVPALCALASCVGSTLSTVPFHEERSQPNWALIYVYREPGFVGGGNAWDVKLDEVLVGRIWPNAYFTVHAAPGTHWVQVGQQPPFALGVAMSGALGGAMTAAVHRDATTDEFHAKSGEVYYLRLSGKEHAFLPREKAIASLRQMKYDRGDDGEKAE